MNLNWCAPLIRPAKGSIFFINNAADKYIYSHVYYDKPSQKRFVLEMLLKIKQNVFNRQVIMRMMKYAKALPTFIRLFHEYHR